MQGKLHQYHLIRALAKKYSHVTYLASPTDEPEHQVILTVLASSLFSLPHKREHVLQKAQRIQELEHPNLVPILDMGIEDEQPFIVRKYLPHDSLRSRLRTLSPDHLKLRDALMIISQIGQALAYAHKHRIFHGNLKPENIFFDANGETVLTDFFLVDRKDAILRDQTTQEYAFCYLAPEQFAGTSDARSDQYALGCLAYELISGHVPFAAQSLASIMGHQNNILPSPLSESIANLPPSLDTAILKTLAKDPAERFFDFSLFLEVIQSVLLFPPAFPLVHSVASRKHRTTSRPTRQPKARVFLSSLHPLMVSSSPPPERPEAKVIQQSEEPIPTTAKKVFDQNQTGTELYMRKQPINDDTSKSGMDCGQLATRKPLISEVLFSEAENDRDQTDSQQDADDVWLTNLFEEQESNDLSPTGSASLGQEQHESGRDTRDEMTVSSPKDIDRDMPLRRRAQPSRSKVLGLALLCFVIVASGGTYAAFSLSRTSKPDSLVRPAQVVNQALIPVQNTISPTQPPTPTATAQPTPQITTIPIVIPTPTPIPRPVVRQIIAIDDSVEGTGLNQFNYVGSGWGHCTGGCNGDYPNAYNGSMSWDNTVGDYMTVSFTGIQIKFYVVVGPKGGIGAISLDGGSETMIDYSAAAFLGDQLLWTSPMLPAGTHTFKLRVTGIKDPSSTDDYVTVDRVDILS
jgi:serine/threonine protein kinase